VPAGHACQGPILRRRSCGRRMSVFGSTFASAERLVHGWPAVAAAAAASLAYDDAVAVHNAQTGHRLFGVGPCGRGATRFAPQGISGAVCQSCSRTPIPGVDARHLEGGGGDVTAAVDDWCRGPRCFAPGLLVAVGAPTSAPDIRVRQAAAERLVDAVAAAGANARQHRRPDAHRRLRARAGAGRRARARTHCFVRASITAIGHRAETGCTGRDDCRPVVAHGDSQHRQFAHCRAVMWPTIRRRRRWPRTGVQRRADPRPSGREPPQELDAVMNAIRLFFFLNP